MLRQRHTMFCIESFTTMNSREASGIAVSPSKRCNTPDPKTLEPLMFSPARCSRSLLPLMALFFSWLHTELLAQDAAATSETSGVRFDLEVLSIRA